MKIGIVGTGYVGIVTGTCLAEKGQSVTCFDIDEKKIDTYSRGESAIYEPGLSELIQKNLESGNLKFTMDIASFVKESDVIFLCVGTPPLPDGSADLSQVEGAVREIAEHTPEGAYKVIVEKSTVPVGTHKRLKNITHLYNKGKAKFDFVVNSEFLREGSAVEDFLNPDRVVIGVESEKAKEMMLAVYEAFDTEKKIVNPASAEIIKYASNSFLAVKISFINMVADLCEKTGADVEMVADGMGADTRIGRRFLNAGIGYGGSCFPKDVKAFISVLESKGVDGAMLQDVDRFNAKRPEKMVKILEEELWILKNKTIAVWGLAFKPETDDIREAPAIPVVKKLLEKGVTLKMYDPEAVDNFRGLFPESKQMIYCAEPLVALKDAEALLIITDWQQFKDLDPVKFYDEMKLPVVIDGRNIYNEKLMLERGFRYFPIGKGEVISEMKNHN